MSTTAGGPAEKPWLYDKERVRDGIIEVCFFYMGAGKRQGVRCLWRCPECGGEDKYAANPQKRIAGCLNAGCAMPTTMDAIEVISRFEEIPASGAGFLEVLGRGYEILGIPDPRAGQTDAAADKPGDGRGHNGIGTVRPGSRASRGITVADSTPRWEPRKPVAATDQPEGRADGLWSGKPYIPNFQPYPPGPSTDAAVAGSSTTAPGPPERGPAPADPSGKEAQETVEIIIEEDVREESTTHSDAYAFHGNDDAETITVEGEEVADEDGQDPPSGVARMRRQKVEAYRTLATGRNVRAEVYALYEEPDFTLDEELLDAVYEEILRMCLLTDAHREWLKGRGVSSMTAHAARLASMSRKKAHELKKALLTKFSEDDLLRVPGFSKSRLRGLSFTLTGDYLLIPYFDPDGRVATLEGRTIGKIQEGMGKYVSLRGGGNHLYLHPQFLPERIEAFCEGPFGAIVAAQSGIAVGAIQGMRRYRDARSGGSLPELRGVDFSGRRIPYIPDVDVKPQARADVEAALPEACRHLIAAQNGRPAVALLERGKDLDEWLLGMPAADRRAAFTSFVSEAGSLESYEGLDARPVERPPAASEESSREEEQQPPPGVSDHTESAPPAEDSRHTRQERREPLADDGTEDGSVAPGVSGNSRGGPLAGDGRQQTDQAAHDPREGAVTAPVGQEKGTEQDLPLGEPSAEHAGHQSAAEDDEDGQSVALTGKVYRALTRMSSPVERDVTLLKRLGIPEEVARAAGIHSMSPKRAEVVVRKLTRTFGAEDLVRVDGFHEANGGRIGMDFAGDYCLIPVRDKTGTITALQAIPVTEDDTGPVPDMHRKMLVRGAPGDHLYVPGGDPDAIEAIVVGPVEALRLCAAGVGAASIAKIGAYKPAPGKGSMAELEGVDFDGRKVLYAPTFGEPPSRRVLADAANALRVLIARHGGVPAIPEADPEGKQVGRWLMDQSLWERRKKFDELVAGAYVAEGMLQKERRKQSRARRRAEARDAEGAEASTEDLDQDADGEEDGDGANERPPLPPPKMVPPPGGDKSALPPRVRDAPLIAQERAAATKTWLACIGVILAALTFWHLPAQLVVSLLHTYLGAPVSGRELDPVPLVVGWLAAVTRAVVMAAWVSAPAAVVKGTEAGLVVCPVVALILMRRRALYRLIATGRPPQKRWWTFWRQAG